MSKTCPLCQVENCYEDGTCSVCNFTTQDETDLRCCLCGGEILIHYPCVDWSSSGEVSEAEDNIPKCVPECLDYGCLPDIPNWDNIPQPTREETVLAYMELCKRDDV